MKKVLIISVAMVSMFALAGCETVMLTAEGIPQPASMTGNVNKKYTIVKHFSRSLKGWFMVFDLITVSNPSVQKLVHNEILSAQGDAVINIRIKGQTTFWDDVPPVVLSVVGTLVAPPWGSLAGDIVSSRTFTVSGDVIRYTK